MAGIVVPESDWPMGDWSPTEIVVDAIVMAVRGCGDDDTRVAVITEEGRELRILGVLAGHRLPPRRACRFGGGSGELRWPWLILPAVQATGPAEHAPCDLAR